MKGDARPRELSRGVLRPGFPLISGGLDDTPSLSWLLNAVKTLYDGHSRDIGWLQHSLGVVSY